MAGLFLFMKLLFLYRLIGSPFRITGKKTIQWAFAEKGCK